MKQHLLLSALCLSLTIMCACSEDDPVDTTTTTSTTNTGSGNTGGGGSGSQDETPDHCGNGDFDNTMGEYDTDCGGECDPCVSVVASCNVDANELFFVNDFDVPLSPAFTDFTQDSDEFVIMAYDGSINGITGLEITCHGELPATSRRYLVSTSINSVEEGEANVRYFTPTKQHHVAPGSSVWIVKNGNQWRAIICDAEVHRNNTTSTLDNLSTNLPFDPA